MTVSSTTNKVSYSGNGTTTVFAYTFKIFADGDLDVYIRSSTGTETLKTLTTDYTVSNAGVDGGGNVTFGTAPASGETVVIQRKLALTQGTDYVENDPFPAESHEEALDRLTFITQQMQEELDRSIKASVTNTISSTEFAISAADRANKIFAFDGSGDLSVTQELGTYQGDWSASTDYNARDIVKDTSTNNIFICNTSHTSSGSQPLTTNTDSAKWDLLVDAATATTAQTAAAASAAAASTSETNAATSAAAAATSASNASTSETNASTSETNAASSASAASTSASNASTSETNAATSASNASTSETNAAASASAASTSASNASTSETNAATSASNASTSETNAASSASAASTSATNAATSETNAATSATAAAAAQAAAELAADNFDDTYLGAKASDPTVDNDGDALTAGDLYFNTTANDLRVYNGSSWQIAAVSTSGLLATSGGTMTGDLNFGSGNKAIFNSLLQIYNDGSNNYISEQGAGDLIIRAGNLYLKNSNDDVFFGAVANGQVYLTYDNSTKIATDTSGVTVTGRATGTLTTDNDLSFDMNASNQFKCTPTTTAALTFTNITAGQSGNIWLDNSAGVVISAAASTYIASADLTTISTAGVYFLSYYSDGTNVMVSATPAVTSAGA